MEYDYNFWNKKEIKETKRTIKKQNTIYNKSKEKYEKVLT